MKNTFYMPALYVKEEIFFLVISSLQPHIFSYKYILFLLALKRLRKKAAALLIAGFPEKKEFPNDSRYNHRARHWFQQGDPVWLTWLKESVWTPQGSKCFKECFCLEGHADTAGKDTATGTATPPQTDPSTDKHTTSPGGVSTQSHKENWLTLKISFIHHQNQCLPVCEQMGWMFTCRLHFKEWRDKMIFHFSIWCTFCKPIAYFSISE